MSKYSIRQFTWLSIAALFAVAATHNPARADEGMWPFHNPPVAEVAKKYSVNLTAGWLEDLRLSSARFGSSSSFVSADGLILTNHHCGFEALVSASTPEKDLVETGFKADNRGGEISAKGYSIFITNRVDDVTAKITAGTESLTGDALSVAYKKNTEELTVAEQAKAPKGSTVRIQMLNNGYYFYQYQTTEIKDIRVVYAPPRNIGIFGGDPDN